HNDAELAGSTANDLILVLSGNDTLMALYDDDVLIGGTGNDTLYGSLGNDTYLYNPGDGDDTILDYDGLGSISIAGVLTLNGSDLKSTLDPQTHRTTWQSDDGSVTYSLIDGNLTEAATIQ